MRQNKAESLQTLLASATHSLKMLFLKQTQKQNVLFFSFICIGILFYLNGSAVNVIIFHMMFLKSIRT